MGGKKIKMEEWQIINKVKNKYTAETNILENPNEYKNTNTQTSDPMFFIQHVLLWIQEAPKGHQTTVTLHQET